MSCVLVNHNLPYVCVHRSGINNLRSVAPTTLFNKKLLLLSPITFAVWNYPYVPISRFHHGSCPFLTVPAPFLTVPSRFRFKSNTCKFWLNYNALHDFCTWLVRWSPVNHFLQVIAIGISACQIVCIDACRDFLFRKRKNTTTPLVSAALNTPLWLRRSWTRNC